MKKLVITLNIMCALLAIIAVIMTLLATSGAPLDSDDSIGLATFLILNAAIFGAAILSLRLFYRGDGRLAAVIGNASMAIACGMGLIFLGHSLSSDYIILVAPIIYSLINLTYIRATSY